ncbi:pyridoxal kinase [Pneumocystis carinii B80]|uniref:pyridoxal kinase n=1 Tax=Pneumocystis carinii (strain B80) TaxID=1408658 RepID=A0A0W4ZLK4_PNEC8|nr:pyridoxal kinase [Pneumocystis carinii B80]KTW29257.1 pyridoxal kinase [Pneumocystis carinii B80]
MSDLSYKKVLSIQSNVSSGYCGNQCATFPLQLLGFEVSTIHTVQFSNHTGYGRWRGQVFKGQHIMDLYEGLKENGFTKEYDFLLTGYVRGKEGIETIMNIIKDLKGTNPGIGWLLDPVLGDERGFYVSPDVIPTYKQLIPMSDLITPNQFEAELLSGQKITSIESLTSCLECLHKNHSLKHVVITSVQFDNDKENLYIIGSSCKSDYTPRAVKIKVPYYKQILSGVGDLFSALLLGRFNTNIKLLPSDEIPAISLPLTIALEIVVSSVQSVIRNTLNSIEKASVDQDKLSKAEVAKLAELNIIQSQDCLKNPNIEFKATALS